MLSNKFKELIKSIAENYIDAKYLRIAKIKKVPQIIIILNQLKNREQVISKYENMLIKYIEELIILFNQNKTNVTVKKTFQLFKKYFLPILKYLNKKHGYVIRKNYYGIVIFGLLMDLLLLIFGVFSRFMPIMTFCLIIFRFIIVSIKSKKGLVIE